MIFTETQMKECIFLYSVNIDAYYISGTILSTTSKEYNSEHDRQVPAIIELTS